jgi:hypothetical protein
MERARRVDLLTLWFINNIWQYQILRRITEIL